MAQFLHLTGLTSYADAHALQQQLLTGRIRGDLPDTVLLLEHAETITVGRQKGAEQNVLVPDGVPVIHVERGGDVTWHGPGQLVAYPIIQLEGPRQDLHLHLHSLENAVIALCQQLGLPASTDERNTGVWLPRAQGTPQKVCSIGIACRRWVTWHGLALNLTVDLQRFATINPCGFDATVMTRLADHLDPCPRLADVVEPLAQHLATTLEVSMDGLIAGPVHQWLAGDRPQSFG